jgi:N-acetylmuramoyl-L-alanine amidase CwlA
MFMNLLQCILYKNRCYQKQQYITPTRIVIHSTGANNTSLKRYVQPHALQSDGMGGKTREEMLELLGRNQYGNDWNSPSPSVCVNAFIGKLADGTLGTVQTLPWNMRPWGCGAGSKGSFNNNAIQFEICEDNTNNKDYCLATYNEAVELCVYLCKTYKIDPDMIVSHSEAHRLGYASNHGDVEHWWSKHNLTMDGFRKAVKAKLEEPEPKPNVIYRVQVGAFSKRENAEAMVKELKAKGYNPFIQ